MCTRTHMFVFLPQTVFTSQISITESQRRLLSTCGLCYKQSSLVTETFRRKHKKLYLTIILFVQSPHGISVAAGMCYISEALLITSCSWVHAGSAALVWHLKIYLDVVGSVLEECLSQVQRVWLPTGLFIPSYHMCAMLPLSDNFVRHRCSLSDINDVFLWARHDGPHLCVHAWPCL